MTTILVVDDEPLIRDLVAALLRDEGYAVVTAADGHTALEIFRRDLPDLVLMDVMMPRLDGRTAFRAMREHADAQQIPVILMSAAAHPTELERGIAAFVRKPFDLNQLLTLVARLLGRGDAGDSVQ